MKSDWSRRGHRRLSNLFLIGGIHLLVVYKTTMNLCINQSMYLTMAQEQLNQHYAQTLANLSIDDVQTDKPGYTTNQFFIEAHPAVTIKIWKRKTMGLCITLYKKGTTKYITIPYEAWLMLVNNSDVVQCAAEFVQGMVGYTLSDE